MLQIQKLTITQKKDLRVLLKEFSVVFDPGDKAVMIGEEGNGKSTLLKWIYKPELVEGYTECEGERLTGNEKMGYLPQELPVEEKGKTVYEYFSEKDAFWEQAPGELGLLCKEFHVESDFFYSDQLLESLSGGEKIKVQLMRLLMERPTVLLLDEPSNDLDMDTLLWLENFIREFPGILLYISHDEMLIERTANMVIHLEQLHRKQQSHFTVAKMSYENYVTQRQHSFETQRQQALADKRAKQLRDEKYQKVYQSVHYALENCSRQAPSVAKNLKDKMHTVKSMEKRFVKEDERMTKMPEQEEAIFFKLGGDSARMPAGKTVVEYSLPKLMTPDYSRCLARDIFLRVRGAERICIVGANGAGKTTLLRQMAVSMMERQDIRVQYMPQNYEDMLDMEKTPVEFLDDTGDKEIRTRIRTYLGSLKYTPDEMEHPMKELSGGQKAKVLLLKMSLSDVNVLILDEPTRNFSPLSGPVIRQMLKDFPGAIISISHDRKYISEVCTKVYELTTEGLEEVTDGYLENEKTGRPHSHSA